METWEIYFFLQTTYPNKFKCTYAKGEFYSNIIYKHSRHNQPYDVAILDVPDSIPETYFTSCEIAPAKTGIHHKFVILIKLETDSLQSR